MTNLENAPENINGADGEDSPVSAIYENPDIPTVEPLEGNDPNPNFIVLRDSFGLWGFYRETRRSSQYF